MGQLTPTTAGAPIAQFGFNRDQIELVKSVIAKDATDDELKLFLYTAQRTGLDPLTKQIHFVKREVTKKIKDDRGNWSSVKQSQMTIQTGIDGYRAIADRTGTLAGIDDAIFDTESAPHPDKATVTVYRFVNGQRIAYTASARWSEYVQQYEKDEWVNGTKTGNKITVVGPMWTKMPYLMLAKCAEALALRKAFPSDLSGLYTTEEMQQADKPEPEEKTEELKNPFPPSPIFDESQQPEPPMLIEPPFENNVTYEPVRSTEPMRQDTVMKANAEATGATCLGCNKPVIEAVMNYSRKFFSGNVLCYDCQHLDKWQRIQTR